MLSRVVGVSRCKESAPLVPNPDPGRCCCLPDARPPAGTLPHRKYYNLEAYHKYKEAKRAAKGIKKTTKKVRVCAVGHVAGRGSERLSCCTLPCPLPTTHCSLASAPCLQLVGRDN